MSQDRRWCEFAGSEVPPFSLTTFSVGPPADVELLQAELAVESAGVGDDVWVVIRVDDGNRLTGAVSGHAAKGDLR